MTTRYLIGRVDVGPPHDDGSRVLRMFSGDSGTIIEATFSTQVCGFVAAKLLEVEGGSSAG
ncbi:MAG TPA: hypothetical protein VII45_02390 [Solirubrobacterales bacterium]